MASLCKLVKRGAVRANDLPLSNDLEAWPDGSVGRAPTYKVRGREFESRSGRLFSRTFTCHFFQTLLLLLNILFYRVKRSLSCTLSGCEKVRDDSGG